MTPAAARACACALGLTALALGPALARAVQIEGRVVHAERPGPIAGITVLALGLDSDEKPLRFETVTDEDGTFRMEVSAPAAYLLRATFEDHAYPGPAVIFRPGQPETHPPVEITLYERTASGEDLRVGSVQWILSYEAGVFGVQHTVSIQNAGQRIAEAGPDEPPLLRIGLPPGHTEVEAPFGRLPQGARPVGDIIELRGPVFPGPEGMRLQLAYDLPSEERGALRTQLPFPDGAEDVGVYVRDYGVRVDTDAELHPARVARQDDVFYLSFVGFEIPAGSALPIDVQPLAPRAATPRGVAVATTAVLAGLLVWLVGAPVTRQARTAKDGPSAADDDARADAIARLRAAIADLDHDHETGKLSDEDRERLLEELRRDTALEIAREQASGAHDPGDTAATANTRACTAATAGASASPAAAARPNCDCGHAASPGDRFCAACGKAL